MRTLRERLLTPGMKVLDLDSAPSYIHNFDFSPDDDELTVTWSDDGCDYEDRFPLDEESPDCRVLLLTLVS
jgi:hypothetical protein